MKLRFWSSVDNSYIHMPRIWCGYDGKLIFDYDGKEIVAEQFTESHDKDNIEIFENDIVDYQGRIGRVEFFATMFIISWGDQTDNELAYLTIGDLKVIGNIHEDANLLK